MKKLKNIAVKALSLAVAAVTALSVGLNAAASAVTFDDYSAEPENSDLALSQVEKTYGRAVADTMSNDWSFLIVFFKNVDATVELNGKTIHCKKTVSNAEIERIKSDVTDRMPYQFLQDTHGKVGIDAIDYVYVDEPLTNKDLELGICPADYPGTGSGYRADANRSELVRSVLDECLEQNRYSQILIFTPLIEISQGVAGWGGSKYDGVHIAQIIMRDDIYSYYETILHEICHGLETDSKAMNNNRTVNLHDMYNYEGYISSYDWYEYYMNDTLPDGKKGVEPMAFYRLRSDYTPLISNTLRAPANFTAAGDSNTTMTLNWDRGSNGIEYQFGIFTDASFKELHITYNKKNDENFIDLVGLVKGNTYYFGVRSVTVENGKTVYSDWTYLTYTHNGAGSAVLHGDINNDGVFNMADVTAALRMCVNETPLDVRTRSAAGIKDRSLLSMSDVAALLQAYVNS
ncbi:MAG: hypothetical protein K2N56_12190 [Oscillospiraceae bacterium]|nr:hypothetical protein [Oscillospiraceae bacterium]